MTPLADRVRPTSLSEIVGQDHLIGPDSALRVSLNVGQLPSLILWGPPGCGKTTLARCFAQESDLLFLQLSAVLDGVKSLRSVIERAVVAKQMEHRKTLLFVDEIHRWNKAQQDALLPHVETGTIVLIGATTENPDFALNSALKSRVQVLKLKQLDAAQLKPLLVKALTTEQGLPLYRERVAPGALRLLAELAAGDARRALNDLEFCCLALKPNEVLSADRVKERISRANTRHDRSGDDHYSVISALIKSMRGSDAQAALYWLARLIAAGEPPDFIARRLIIFASEDIGNADPRALQIAMNAAQAVKWIGMPEGRIPLAQAVTWLSTSPKSNASYKAIDAALADVKRFGALPVPVHLRNPTGSSTPEYGDGYLYPHDFPHHIVKQTYLPTSLKERSYYKPASHGVEKTIGERMAWWADRLKQDR